MQGTATMMGTTGKSQEDAMGELEFRSPFDEAAWMLAQVDRYGPIIGGEELRKFLGFRTAAAFQKWRAVDSAKFPLFNLSGRKGSFAMTQEAGHWLLSRRASAILDTTSVDDSGKKHP